MTSGTLSRMPRYQNSPDPYKPAPATPDWFDRLPKKLRALLLAMLCLVGCAAFFLMGMHSIHVGHPIYSIHHTLSAGACFVWSACWLVIAGMLFGVSQGWIKSREDGPPQ